MNVLNWIQQERVADYHVVKWRTSHFHEPIDKTELVGQVKMNTKPLDIAPTTSGTQSQPEGIGLGLTDSVGDRRYRSGGFGTDGLALDGLKDATNNKVMATSRKTQGSQATGPETASTVMQTILPAEIHSVAESARQSALKVQGRIRQSVAKLKKLYGKQSGQLLNTKQEKSAPRRQSKKKQRGTRRISKDEVLAMQAENHYLLDSYDKNGQYSTLGK